MAINRGKQFEQTIKDAFLKVTNVSVDRLHDQTTGYKHSSANICDFIVYKKPGLFYIECKTTHGNTLPFSNISANQWDGLLEKSKIDGVAAGIICWWVDRDVTWFIPIQFLQKAREAGFVSVPFDFDKKWVLDGYSSDIMPIAIGGKKKRVFFEYNMVRFLEELSLTTHWG